MPGKFMEKAALMLVLSFFYLLFNFRYVRIINRHFLRKFTG